MLCASAFLFAFFYIFHLQQLHTELEEHNARVIADLEYRNAQLKTELATLKDAQQYEARKMNITKYAPLDPDAVEGWDYAGDPEITASGRVVVPEQTAAAGPNIPFGTRIYVEGKGWYVVKDRGGRIGPGDIDLAVETKEESTAWGVRQRLVIIELQNED